MPYMHMLADPGMNYTLNRPLMDGTSQARIREVGAVASQITDYQSWHDVWLTLAKRAEAENRWLDAASYYHGAEFYLPASEVRDGLYDDFARNWAMSMQDCRRLRTRQGPVYRRPPAGIPDRSSLRSGWVLMNSRDTPAWRATRD
jgi:hypothetical protein